MRLARTLPGELEGEVDPEEYGFEVVSKEHPPTKEEITQSAGRLYAQAKARTGIVIPKLEPYLEETSQESLSEESEPEI